MSDIEWTDTVWNPVLGCSRVSAGCQNCYAERFAHRGLTERHRGLTVMGSKGPRWTGEVRLVPEVLGTPLTWRKPRRVFVNSMSDLFHEGVSFEFIAAVFGVMAAAPQHTFQVLTKRPARMREFFEWLSPGARFLAFPPPPIDKLACLADDALTPHMSHADLSRAFAPGRGAKTWPLPNVWLGVSVEDQATADERIPLLLECPAAVRWVSYEPALGPVDFGRFLRGRESIPGVISPSVGFRVVPRLDWIVVGGESGPGARPFDVAWARSVISQCAEADVACFVKQFGAVPYDSSITDIVGPDGSVHYTRPPAEAQRMIDEGGPDHGYSLRPHALRLRDRKGGDMAAWPEDLRVRQWPALVEQVRAELAKEPS